MTAIMAFDTERTDNATAIEECAKLRYLRKEWRTLDPTYGKGRFWTKWEPWELWRTDKNPAKSLDIPTGIDFTAMPFPDEFFEAVVYDPPYKLNGTPSGQMDEDYGVDEPTRWQDRMQLCKDGIVECERVAAKVLLVKCQDQVCSGAMRFQTREFATLAEALGLRHVTTMHVSSYREQPAGTTQKHPRQNYSSLMVFEKGRALR